MQIQKAATIAIALVFGLACLSASAVSQEGPADLPSHSVGWQLSGSKAINQGRTARNQQGVFIQGYTLQALATGTPGSGLPSGDFRLTLDLFSPAKDMPGQKTGRWYLNGSWTISPSDSGATANPAQKVVGSVTAELEFNPVASQGTMRVTVFLKRMVRQGRRVSGRATFFGNQKFEGTLSLSARRAGPGRPPNLGEVPLADRR